MSIYTVLQLPSSPILNRSICRQLTQPWHSYKRSHDRPMSATIMKHLLKTLVLLLGITCCLSLRVPRITRGSVARPHEFKSIVHIQVKQNGGFIKWCGGTLLNSRTVLTAGHCKSNAPMRVYVGLHRASEVINPSSRVQMAEAQQQIRHKQYNIQTISHDIMVLKLDRSINESPTVEYARLPSVQDQFPPASTSCILAGWGMTSPRSVGSDVLRKGPLTAVVRSNHKDKSILYARPGGPTQTSACKGDSGGPLYCPANDHGKPFVVGAVSGGDGKFCGSRHGLARFASVAHVLNWIRSLM